MKKTFIKIGALCLLAAIIFSLAACTSPESAIIGSWVTDYNDEYTFFKDGSVIIIYGDSRTTRDGTYSIEGSKLLIRTGSTLIVDFEIKGKQLIIKVGGEDYILKKK